MFRRQISTITIFSLPNTRNISILCRNRNIKDGSKLSTLMQWRIIFIDSWESMRTPSDIATSSAIFWQFYFIWQRRNNPIKQYSIIDRRRYHFSIFYSLGPLSTSQYRKLSILLCTVITFSLFRIRYMHSAELKWWHNSPLILA